MFPHRCSTFLRKLTIRSNANLLCCSHAQSRRQSTLSAASFQAAATNPASRYQIYLSESHDPFVNLSIEHFLLQQSPPDSTILFLYINRNCVVIGRNQNPWLETNMNHRRFASERDNSKNTTSSVPLVRRRSGGGTVFHDFGNLNYCVICPVSDFTRDKHAQMVTRAIRTLNPRARVNERHDIVLDQGGPVAVEDKPDDNDCYQTAYYPTGDVPEPLKVSGSAYRITRNRALHHGTCLVSSPNVKFIDDLQYAPKNSFISAKGVQSVRASVGNIITEKDVPSKETSLARSESFRPQIMQAFADLYKIDRKVLDALFNPELASSVLSCSNCVGGYLGDEVSVLSDIKPGIVELQSPQWIYEKTPEFHLSSHRLRGDDEEQRDSLPHDFPKKARVELVIKSGIITSSSITYSSNPKIALAQAESLDKVLRGQKIHDIWSFEETLKKGRPDRPRSLLAISEWLDDVFGNPINIE